MSVLMHKGKKVAETMTAPFRGIISEEDFEALPKAEQDNGIWFIDNTLNVMPVPPGEEYVTLNQLNDSIDEVNESIANVNTTVEEFRMSMENSLGDIGSILDEINGEEA